MHRWDKIENIEVCKSVAQLFLRLIINGISFPLSQASLCGDGLYSSYSSRTVSAFGCFFHYLCFLETKIMKIVKISFITFL